MPRGVSQTAQFLAFRCLRDLPGLIRRAPPPRSKNDLIKVDKSAENGVRVQNLPLTSRKYLAIVNVFSHTFKKT